MRTTTKIKKILYSNVIGISFGHNEWSLTVISNNRSLIRREQFSGKSFSAVVAAAYKRLHIEPNPERSVATGDAQSSPALSTKKKNTKEGVKSMKWITIEQGLPNVGENVLVVTEYLESKVEKSDTFYGYMGEDGELYMLPEEDSYGWQFDDCVTKWARINSDESESIPSVTNEEDELYWKERCKAAEDCICDLNIESLKKFDVYQRWQAIKDQSPLKEDDLWELAKKKLLDLMIVEGKIKEVRKVMRSVAIIFESGSAYWLRLEKQSDVSLDN